MLCRSFVCPPRVDMGRIRGSRPISRDDFRGVRGGRPTSWPRPFRRPPCGIRMRRWLGHRHGSTSRSVAHRRPKGGRERPRACAQAEMTASGRGRSARPSPALPGARPIRPIPRTQPLVCPIHGVEHTFGPASRSSSKISIRRWRLRPGPAIGAGRKRHQCGAARRDPTLNSPGICRNQTILPPATGITPPASDG